MGGVHTWTDGQARNNRGKEKLEQTSKREGEGWFDQRKERTREARNTSTARGKHLQHAKLFFFFPPKVDVTMTHTDLHEEQAFKDIRPSDLAREYRTVPRI